MNPTLWTWIKRLLFPALLVLAHTLSENLPALTALIPVEYQAYLTPLILFIGGAILHALPAPGTQPPVVQ